MQQEFIEIIKKDENYKNLVKRRVSFSLKLTFAILIVYFSFILLIAFKPSILSIPLYDGAVTTVGIPLGIAIIVFSFVLTGVYTFKANSEFDDLAQKISKNLEEKK